MKPFAIEHPALPRVCRAAALLLLVAACSSDSRRTPADSTRSPDTTASPIALNGDSGTSDSVRMLTDSLLGIADAARITGNPAAKVWLVVMSDFQCPVCRDFHDQVYPAIQRDYIDRGKVRVAYVNLPLTIHRHAWPAAERAMCAGLQGKFWEYHHALFEAFDRWTPLDAPAPVFDSLGAKLGLDREKEQLCVSSGVTRRLIAADLDRSSQSGASATPSFLVGGRLLEGTRPYSVFREILDSALVAAGGAGVER